MNLGFLNASWRLASLSNKILLISNLVLSFMVAVLGSAAINNRDRITVTPPTIDKPYVIGWSSASPDYYKDMALFFSYLIGTVGPKTVDFVISALERFCAPDVADEFKRKVRAIAADYEFRQSSASSWFEGDRLAWEQKSGKVFVIGKLKASSAGHEPTSKEVVFEYKIVIREGQPVLAHFDSYNGNVPHTLLWLQDPKKAEMEAKRHDKDDAVTAERGAELDIRESNEAALRAKTSPTPSDGQVVRKP